MKWFVDLRLLAAGGLLGFALGKAGEAAHVSVWITLPASYLVGLLLGRNWQRILRLFRKEQP